MQTNTNINFKGSATAQLDSKGRFLLPKVYKDRLPDGQKENFVLSIGFNNSLKLFPESVWDAKMNDALGKYDSDSEEAEALIRKFGSNSDAITMDAAGRINIDNKFLLKAGLKKTLFIIPMINHLEIWEHETYLKFEENEATLAELTKSAKEASRPKTL